MIKPLYYQVHPDEKGTLDDLMKRIYIKVIVHIILNDELFNISPMS